MVGSTPCSTAPRMLKTSPASQTMRNWRDRPSALPRLKFSTIWGEKTTTQQAMEMEPQIPEIASTSRFSGAVGGAIFLGDVGKKKRPPLFFVFRTFPPSRIEKGT